MPSHAQSLKQIEREDRRKKVAANLVAGLTYRQIAEALQCALGTVHKDVRVILQRWQREQVQLLDEQRQLEVRRLDLALNALWGKVLQGEEAAVDRFLRIAERRAKLLGLDAPTKVAPTTPEGTEPYPLQGVRERLAVLFGVPLADLPMD